MERLIVGCAILALLSLAGSLLTDANASGSAPYGSGAFLLAGSEILRLR